jgi:hypothetical protein
VPYAILLFVAVLGIVALPTTSHDIERAVEVSAEYPFCYWSGSMKRGAPDAWGVGGCVVGREPPGKERLAPPITKPVSAPCVGNTRDECECLFELHLFAAATIDNYVTFRGAYMLGQRNGEGTFFYSNGQIYRGAWKDDMRHGEGTLYGPACEVIYSGSWRADQPAGQTSS